MRFLRLVLVLGIAIIAQAHKPVFKHPGTSLRDALLIEDPTASWAFYGNIEGFRSEWFQFSGKRGMPVFVQLLIPVNADHKMLTMRAMLAGPGLPESAGPMVLPKGYGTRNVKIDSTTTGEFYEKFTQIRYRASEPLRLELPADGVYGVAVSGSGGRYVLAVGEREDFSVSDVARFPFWWRNARQHADLPVWYGLVVFGLIIVGIAYLLTRLVLRISSR